MMLTFALALLTLVNAAPYIERSFVDHFRPLASPDGYKLALYQTKFKTDSADQRVHNIELGARRVDGSVLEPGAVWSFNETVGPRDHENGFETAPTLFMGEVLEGYGGGMCQVSSTVHAAALWAGIEVVERHAHSRPSGYIKRGFDAAVNYPENCRGPKPDLNTCFDLKLRNPYDFPIMILAGTGGDTIGVELWGQGPIAEVDTAWKLYETPPFEQRMRRMPKAGTWKQKKQSGQPGANGALLITITWPDGRSEKRTAISHYKPVDELWYVGRDWDKTQKPWE